MLNETIGYSTNLDSNSYAPLFKNLHVNIKYPNGSNHLAINFSMLNKQKGQSFNKLLALSEFVKLGLHHKNFLLY